MLANHSQSTLSLRKILEHLLLVLHGQHTQNLRHALESTFLITSQHSRDLVRHTLRLHRLDLGMDLLSVLLVPDRDVLVVGPEARERRPRFQRLEVLRPGDEFLGAGGDHAFEDVFFVQTSSQAPVEEAARGLPGQAHADRVFGLHAAGAVVEIGVLETDLHVDWQ